MAKTISEQQLIGRQGESLVSAKANSMGLLFSSYGPIEAGIDGFIELRDEATRTVSAKMIAVQVKTQRAGRYPGETDDAFHLLFDDDDLEYWRGSNLPVIVVLVHLEREAIYWKAVPKSGRRIDIDKSADQFGATAKPSLEALAANKSQFGVWFKPPRAPDPAHLNLLKVKMPGSLFVAPSLVANGKQANIELLKRDGHPPQDWILRGGQLFSFRNLRQSVLKHIADTAAIEEWSPSEFATTGIDEERVMADLLRRTLQQQFDGELGYDRDQRALYFLAAQDRVERTFEYQSLKRVSKADVVKKIEGKRGAVFVRHHAFQPRFIMIADDWFLAINSTYVFTRDGWRPDAYAGERISGKKRLERNPALLGQFLMWSRLLTESKIASGQTTLFQDSASPTRDPADRLLTFEMLDPIAFDRAVPDELWLQSDPDADELQADLLI